MQASWTYLDVPVALPVGSLWSQVVWEVILCLLVTLTQRSLIGDCLLTLTQMSLNPQRKVSQVEIGDYLLVGGGNEPLEAEVAGVEGMLVFVVLAELGVSQVAIRECPLVGGANEFVEEVIGAEGMVEFEVLAEPGF